MDWLTHEVGDWPEVDDYVHDRDAQVLRFVGARAAGMDYMTPAMPGTYGRGLCRRSEVMLPPHREDHSLEFAQNEEGFAHHRDSSVADIWEGFTHHRFGDAAASARRNVPLGYARYISPVVDPRDYTYRRVGGWRVAIPRLYPRYAADHLLRVIYVRGPLAAGFAAVGDTLVPANLGPGDRRALAAS